MSINWLIRRLNLWLSGYPHKSLLKKNRFLLPCSVLFLFHFSALAQQWNSTKIFSETPAIQFQWRIIRQSSEASLKVFEWEFSNTSDSIITFNYTIVSSSTDQRKGRVTLQPQSRKLSGWFLNGYSIVAVEIANVIFLKHTNWIRKWYEKQ